MPLDVPLLFMAVPVVLALLWLWILGRHRRLFRRQRAVPAGWVTSPTPGLVTAEETWWNSRQSFDGSTGAVVHRPIVTYRPASGGEVTFRSGFFGTFMPRPDATVGVVHDPADPTRARLAPDSIPRTFRRLSTAVFVVMAIGFVPLAVLFEGVGWFMLTHR